MVVMRTPRVVHGIVLWLLPKVQQTARRRGIEVEVLRWDIPFASQLIDPLGSPNSFQALVASYEVRVERPLTREP